MQPQDQDVMQIRRQQQTLVLRKMPFKCTTSSLFNDFSKITSPENILSIHRDQLDPRRFYVTFTSTQLKRDITSKELLLCGIKIPPTKCDARGYIPYPPPYLDQQDLTTILSAYGEVVSSRFRRARGYNTIIGGLEFDLLLKDDTPLPSHFIYDGVKHTIQNRDDRQFCSACKHYGHLQQHCRKRRSTRPTPPGPRPQPPADVPEVWGPFEGGSFHTTDVTDNNTSDVTHDDQPTSEAEQPPEEEMELQQHDDDEEEVDDSPSSEEEGTPSTTPPTHQPTSTIKPAADSNVSRPFIAGRRRGCGLGGRGGSAGLSRNRNDSTINWERLAQFIPKEDKLSLETSWYTRQQNQPKERWEFTGSCLIDTKKSWEIIWWFPNDQEMPLTDALRRVRETMASHYSCTFGITQLECTSEGIDARKRVGHFKFTKQANLTLGIALHAAVQTMRSLRTTFMPQMNLEYDELNLTRSPFRPSCHEWRVMDGTLVKEVIPHLAPSLETMKF